MSVVSGVTVLFSCAEELEEDVPPFLPEMNEWLASHGGARLLSITGAYGGNKHPQIGAYGAGINCLQEDEFAEMIGALPWQLRENVVLVIQPEDGPTRIWRFSPEWCELCELK